MCAKLIPLSDCALESNPHHSIAVYAGKVIDQAQFNADVSALASQLLSMQAEKFALYYEQAFPFCVALFALLHSDKEIWIAANNKQLSAEKLVDQGCLLLGDWQDQECSMEQSAQSALKLQPLDINQQLTIFTSGSHGEAKAINKSLQQLQCEIDTLERYWGELLGQNSEVLATVSHQHIYGLLFRVLWPLSAGRCFHSEMYLSPEPLLKVANPISAYWVASPAQLKRLDELTPWQDMADLTAIFSSGGALPQASASQIYKHCGHKILEIYGSSETGGIAWRQSVDQPLWTLFKGISLTVKDGQGGYLSSPYLPTTEPFLLDDKIELREAGHFALLGRVDHIVKVEEKRLSLNEMERALCCSDWIKNAYTLLLSDKRDKISAALVLTDAGHNYLQQQGRNELIKQLRKQLMQAFETVVLPRKWLFVPSLPLTAQGKINRDLLTQLFSLDSTRFPLLQSYDDQQEMLKLQLKVPSDLVYFAGHFPNQPILPGVTQLAWVECLGKIFFDINLPFLHMEVIKFKKIIRPGDTIEMHLNWNASKGKLYFELSSASESHSSGRLVYGAA